MKNWLKIICLIFILIGCTSSNKSDDLSDTSATAEEQLSQSGEALTEEELLGGNNEVGTEDADIAGGEDFEDSFEDFGDEVGDNTPVADAENTVEENNSVFSEDNDAFSADAQEQNLDQAVNDESSGDLVEDSGDDFSAAGIEDDFSSEDSAGVAQSAVSSEVVTITGLDFLANENGGTIVIKASGPTTYSTRSNPENKQFIIEVPNAKLGKQFQRPYNTNEFKGAIGMFQAYQNPDGTTARFVVQLNADQEPLVQQEGNNILVVASNLESETTSEAAVTEAPADEFASNESEFEPAVDESAVAADEQALNHKSLEDYLSGNTKYYGRKINIEVKDWEIRDVFDFIAEQSGLNIVLSEEVKGKISLKLREIPWDQALIVVMQTKQLGYKRQGNIVRIAPLATLRAETDTARQVINSQRLLQPTQVKILPVNYAKAQDLEGQVKEFLTPNRGKVKADTRTNSLVVTDLPENIKKVTQLVQSLDTETPQVLIEAKVIEAQESFSKQIGVDWSGGALNGTSADLGASVSAGLTSPVGSIQFGSAATDFMATFSLLETENIIKVLSSPRIIGLNNRKAKISQTSEIPIRKSENINGTVTETVTYIPLVLSLEVTPQVTSQGSIIMALNLSREFAGEQETDGRPLFKRNAQTNVIVNNGETAVIGGIYKSDATTAENGVPFLSKIPVLGYLFKSDRRSTEKNELMMFITPRVMNLNKAFAGDSAEEELIEEQSEFL